jgi:hypothetical protein
VPSSGDWSNTEEFNTTSRSQHPEPEHYRPLPLQIVLPPAAVVTDSHRTPLPDPPVAINDTSIAHEGHAVATAEKLGQIFSLGEEFPVFSVSTETLEVPEPAHSNPPFSHELRNSQVVRKVNSSFEILRPGTLITQFIEPDSPVEHNKDDDRRYSRKLRKARTSTGERTRSSVTEVIYNNERHAH